MKKTPAPTLPNSVARRVRLRMLGFRISDRSVPPGRYEALGRRRRSEKKKESMSGMNARAYGVMAIRHIVAKMSAVCEVFTLTETGTWRCNRRQ